MSNPIRTQKIKLDPAAENERVPSAYIRSLAGKDKSVQEGASELPFEQLVAVADSHTGFVRRANEDSYSYYINNEQHQMLAAVADGVGGHSNGDIASYLTIKMLTSAWREFQFGETLDDDPEKVRAFLYAKIEEINSAIYKINAQYNAAHPMGTTVAAAVILKKHVVVAHAGDSRVYRKHGDVLERLTEDHSLVADMIRSGAIPEEEEFTHPYAHVISKSIGPLPVLDPETHIYDWTPGDKLLVCTDGLILHLTDEEIKEILSAAQSPENAAKKMMSATLRKGGGDNITFICCFDRCPS